MHTAQGRNRTTFFLPVEGIPDRLRTRSRYNDNNMLHMNIHNTFWMMFAVRQSVEPRRFEPRPYLPENNTALFHGSTWDGARCSRNTCPAHWDHDRIYLNNTRTYLQFLTPQNYYISIANVDRRRVATGARAKTPLSHPVSMSITVSCTVTMQTLNVD